MDIVHKFVVIYATFMCFYAHLVYIYAKCVHQLCAGMNKKWSTYLHANSKYAHSIGCSLKILQNFF